MEKDYYQSVKVHQISNSILHLGFKIIQYAHAFISQGIFIY